MKIRVTEPNPDGLDEVFEAYQTLRMLVGHELQRWEREDPEAAAAVEAQIGEPLEMLETWLASMHARNLEAGDEC